MSRKRRKNKNKNKFIILKSNKPNCGLTNDEMEVLCSKIKLNNNYNGIVSTFINNNYD